LAIFTARSDGIAKADSLRVGADAVLIPDQPTLDVDEGAARFAGIDARVV
jgi:hypothetical protein